MLFRNGIAAFKVTRSRQLAQPLNILPEDRLLSDHYLEAVVLRGIVGACYHQAPVGIQMMHREIELGRGPHADSQGRDAGSGEPLDPGGLESRRRKATVIANGHPAAA